MHQFTQTLSTSNIGNSFDKCIQIIAYAQVKKFKDKLLKTPTIVLTVDGKP